MTTAAAWLAALAPEQRAQVDHLAAAVRDAAPQVEAAVKWGRLTFTLADDWHHWLCAIAVTKAGVRLMFHKGALLADPERLLTGTGRYLRQLPYDRATAHPDAVTALLRDAVVRRTDMLP